MARHKRWGWTFAASLCVWMWVASFASAAPKANATALGPGDLIFLRVPTHKTLNRRLQLDNKGYVIIPSLGKERLSGRTPAQAARFLQKRLSTYFKGLQVQEVQVLKRQKYVWIRGWVTRPGRYLLRWRDGIEVLLRKAKGFRPGARLNELWIHQSGSAPKRFDLLRYYQRGKQHKAPTLRRNAVVFVPAGLHLAPEAGTKSAKLQPGVPRLAVLGAVKKPGIFPCFWQVNLMQALAMAGGPLASSGLQEVLITPPKGRTYWFDLKRHLRGSKGGKALPLLAAGSVVFVPFRPVGRSRRGPVRVIGQVGKPGIWRGAQERDLLGWLARSGGPTSNADMSSITVVYQGSNFTITQQVDAKDAIQKGQPQRLPPTPKGQLLIYVPKKQTSPDEVQAIQTGLQIAISLTSVVTSVVLLVVTLTR